MTREELKAHCERQIQECETWAKYKGIEPSGKIYEEHRLILELLEQQPKIGYWTYICNNSVNGLKICECSNCEKRTYGSHKYCPNCGAKMEYKE